MDNCPGQAGDTAAEAALAEAQVAKALAERQTRLAEQVEWYGGVHVLCSPTGPTAHGPLNLSI